MPAQRPPLPTFIIIGAQKSATRWLRYNLGLHPDMFTAPRELKFFNHPKRYRILGTDWYRDQFQGWAGEAAIGEATPGYLIPRHRPPEVAARIHETVPNVRLIAVLRNPVDRAHSALAHHVRQERVHPRSRLLDIVRANPPELDWLGLVDAGKYSVSLEPFLDLFGNQVLVLLYDAIQSGAPQVYREALLHVAAPVGASGDFVPPALLEVKGAGRTSGPAQRETLEERLELFETFSADVHRLERMLDRDLSIWKPASAPDGSPEASARSTSGLDAGPQNTPSGDRLAGPANH